MYFNDSIKYIVYVWYYKLWYYQNTKINCKNITNILLLYYIISVSKHILLLTFSLSQAAISSNSCSLCIWNYNSKYILLHCKS